MTNENIGKRIELIRKNLNMTKKQFGSMIGVSGQYIGLVEKGTHGLSVKAIVNICNEANVSSDYILMGITKPMNEAAAAASSVSLSPEQMHIAFDIITKVADFINTKGGNEALIREVASQQYSAFAKPRC